MRSMSRTSILISLVAALAVFLLPSAAFAEGPWSFEVRAAYVNPIEDDGTITSTRSTTGDLDMLKSIVPELAIAYQATDRFAVEVAALWANMEMELGFAGAGDVDFGDTDMQMYSLSGLFDAAEWGNSVLRLGISVAYADFDDIDITTEAADGAASSSWALTSSSLDTATLFGFVVRFDTALRAEGWYFTSNLRYLIGSSDFEIVGTDLLNPQPSGVIWSGDFDFDPLVASFGFGYRY